MILSIRERIVSQHIMSLHGSEGLDDFATRLSMPLTGNGPRFSLINPYESLKLQKPTINQMADILQRHEQELHWKMDESNSAFEKYSQDMTTLEEKIEKKNMPYFTKTKTSSETFLKHMREAMEMISKITQTMYDILESITEKEIERDPVGFILEESFRRPPSEEEKKYNFEEPYIESFVDDGSNRDMI